MAIPFDMTDPRLRAAAQSIMGGRRRITLPEMTVGPRITDQQARSLPAATPAEYPTFEQWQADPTARDAASALSASEVERSDAENLAADQARAGEAEFARTWREQYPDVELPTSRALAESALAAVNQPTVEEKIRQVNAAVAPRGMNGKAGQALTSMATGAALQPPPAPPPEQVGPFASMMSGVGDVVKRGAQHVGNFLVPEWVPPVQDQPPTSVQPSSTPALAPMRETTPQAAAALRTIPKPAPRPGGAAPPVSVGMAAPTPAPRPFEPIATARPQAPAASPAGSVPTAPGTTGNDDADLLARAQEAVRNNTMLANLARAGGMMIGRGGDPAYGALERQAGAPLEEFAQGDALKQREIEAARAMAAGKSARDFAREQQAAKFSQEEKMKRMEGQARVDAAKARARGGAGAGKLLPSTEAARVGDLDAAVSMVDSLLATRNQKADRWHSGVSQFIPGTEAAEYGDAARAAAQAVGYILEGGKLSDQDVPRYVNMLPTPGDSDERAMAKAEEIKKLLSLKRSGQLDAFGKAGYRTQGLEKPMPAARPTGQPRKQYSASRNQTRLIYPDGRVEVVSGRR